MLSLWRVLNSTDDVLSVCSLLITKPGAAARTSVLHCTAWLCHTVSNMLGAGPGAAAGHRCLGARVLFGL
jgi:hypothetical protein